MFPPPSPADRVRYMAVASELNGLLAGTGISVDPKTVISNTLEVVSNPRPEWILLPNVTTITKEYVNVSFSCTTAGTVYAEVIPDTEMIPSPRQVANSLSAFNTTSKLVASKAVTPNVTTWLVVKGLIPTTSYILIVTAKNSNTRLTRYMEEDLTAKINIITQAGHLATNETLEAACALAAALWLVLT